MGEKARNSMGADIESKLMMKLNLLSLEELENVVRRDNYIDLFKNLENKNDVVKNFLRLIRGTELDTTQQWFLNRLKIEILGGTMRNKLSLDQDVELELYQIEQELSVANQLRNLR